ncbi:MAG: hypothetical protein JRN21_10085 [Nitrososphaerota archaeon]|nr:hypothetical protein [Nitrososphaerota archaeon]
MTAVRVFVRSELVLVDKYEVDIAVPIGQAWHMPLYERKVHYRKERMLDAKSKAAVLEAQRLASEVGCEVDVIDVSGRNFMSRMIMNSMFKIADLPAITVCGEHVARGLKLSQPLVAAPMAPSPA